MRRYCIFLRTTEKKNSKNDLDVRSFRHILRSGSDQEHFSNYSHIQGAHLEQDLLMNNNFIYVWCPFTVSSKQLLIIFSYYRFFVLLLSLSVHHLLSIYTNWLGRLHAVSHYPLNRKISSHLSQRFLSYVNSLFQISLSD